jgi:hypothetical protein
MPLTDSIARNAKPAAKTIRIFDHDGLYLEVSPRGGKWWRLKYRFAGKEKRVSLGVYPEVNLKRARARTIEARQLLDAGVDPSENRRAAKAAQMDGAANSFEVVTREWIEQQMKTWVRGHGERILTRFERDIFPWIGARPIADLTAPELLTTVRRIEKRVARWRLRIGRSATAARCSAMPSPPAAPDAIPPAICAAPSPRLNLRTLPP